MTPAAFYCTQKCVFCWRAQTEDLKLAWNELDLPKWDNPEEIVQESIEAQERILTGYPDNPKTNRRKYREALRPKHVAISLTGEPTLYKHLNELIQAFHARGFTTFLVTNGTIPSALAHLNEEPTQLYVSICAPDEETYNHICRPQIPKAWQKLERNTPTVAKLQVPNSNAHNLCPPHKHEKPRRIRQANSKGKPNLHRSKSIHARGLLQTSPRLRKHAEPRRNPRLLNRTREGDRLQTDRRIKRQSRRAIEQASTTNQIRRRLIFISINAR